MNSDKLYVVTCVFNPENYQSRYRLYRNFVDYVNQFANVELWTVELVFGDQSFAVTQANNPHHIQLKTTEVLWYKENLLNIGIGRLPADARYIAWIDADIEFETATWAEDTMRALDQHAFVQMFKRANDLGPDGQVISSNKGFVYKWLKGSWDPKNRGRSGLAWAATREALDAVGGLIDWGIVGSGDWFMAFSLTDQMAESSLQVKSGGYSLSSMQAWADRCTRYINQNVGYVDGVINHFWHGKKSDRGYNWRWRILSENQFDPLHDLEYHANGLIKLKASKPKLLEDIRFYFQSRNEDAKET